jgi:pimeloyl-ACP methyl ester carboxylesterase
MLVWFVFVIILLIALGLLCGGVVLGMANMLLKPPRMTDGKATYVLQRLSPGDLDLPFEDVKFEVHDAAPRQSSRQASSGKLEIAAWWIPPRERTGKCAVLIHGYGDAKVGAIAWAPTFHALGYGCLAIDLRAHGESDGKYTTAGYFERHDVGDVINQVRAARPSETQSVILFGVSLGAAVAAAVAAERDDIDAVVLESPYADYRHAIAAHAEILGQPGGFLQELGVRLAERISGADFNAVRPVDLIPQIKAPLMIVQAGDDPFVPAADAKRVEQAATSRPAEYPTVYWHVELAPHVQALSADPAGYREKLEEFLEMPALVPSPLAPHLRSTS